MWSRNHSPQPLVDPAKLRFALENRLNLLLKGPHGVGKTSLVKKVFAEAGLSLMVFSGATMDPWVDFVGVPRPVVRPDGVAVLELVRRKEFVEDSIDGIFIDEFNRAPAKVRNAAMELIQFQSINGERLGRLRCVWAAVNPDESGDYDVEKLDPAQLDRFHITLEIPNRPCPAYFIHTFGSQGRAALEWWDAQSSEAKSLISPRRLEYALKVHLAGGPLRHALPPAANIKGLVKLLKEGPLFDRLKDLIERGDKVEARDLLTDPLDGSQALSFIVGSRAACLFFLPLLPQEKLMSLLYNPLVMETVVRFSASVPEFREILEILATQGGDKALMVQAEIAAKKAGIKLGSLDQPVLVPHTAPLDRKTLEEIDPHGRFTA